MNGLMRDYRDAIKERMARDPEFVFSLLAELDDAQNEIVRLEKLLERVGPQGEEIW